MIKKIALAAALLTSVSGTAQARTDQNVAITGVGCGQDGVCYANVATPVGPTSCSNRNQVRWAGTTNSGKNFTATMLTAKASGALTNIGTVDGSCSGAFPTLNFVTVK